MARRIRLLVLLAAGIAMLNFAPVAHADHGELTTSIASVDDSDYPTVRAVINVDHGGLPLQGLSTDQIAATEGGSAAVVRSLEPVIDAEIPIALVLVIDTSGSVSGELIEEVRTAAIELVDQLGPSDSAAVISFADDVTVAQELTTDHAVVIQAIEALSARGNTALYDAVRAASALSALANVPRSTVVLLSDGAEYGGFSSATRETSLTDIEGGAPFYVIGVGAWVDLAYLEEVAGRSGGRYFAAGTVAEIDDVYAAIEELLRSQYVLTIETASELAAAERELSITVTSGEQSATATKTYSSRQPVGQVPAAATPAAQTPPVVPAAQPAVTAPAEQLPAESSSSLTPVLLGSLVALMLLALAAVLIRRRSQVRRHVPLPPSAVDRRPLRAIAVERAATESGYLVPLTVAGVETEVPLGQGPITIGTAADCRARVAISPDVASQHARIWERDGRPMLHHVADGYETCVNGSPVGWAALTDGDEIAIGPYRFRFVSQLQSQPAAPREASA